jgi:hypothetical protein
MGNSGQDHVLGWRFTSKSFEKFELFFSERAFLAAL